MESDRERPVVLLVPGAFGQNYVYWNVVQYRLERDGFHVYNLNFPRFTLSDVTASANMLAEKIDEIRAIEGGRRIALLGHSMGGIISRYYMKHLNDGDRIDSLVCFGTPHHGTYSALPGLPLKGARQVLPGSDFLKDLNADVDHVGGPPFLNVWSRTDVIVIPQRSAVLPMAGVENRAITLGGHWGLLVAPRAYTWAREWFATPPEVRRVASRPPASDIGLDGERASPRNGVEPSRGL